MSRCDECGTELINKCSLCGAPVCCPKCCREVSATAYAFKGDAEITRLEASMKRLDDVDDEEIDSEEYQRILDRLVKLRKERDGQ